MTDIDAVRARHVQMTEDPDTTLDLGQPYCRDDLDPWPCDTAIVLAALDSENVKYANFLWACNEQRDDAIERERRLRAALEAIHGYVFATVTIPALDQKHLLDFIDSPAALATTPEGES